MEQKKTLWIIAAAGAFLLVVLGFACILYSPAAKPYSTIASVSPVEKRVQEPKSGWTTPTVEPVNTTAPVPVTPPQDVEVTTKVNDMVVIADTAKVIGATTEVEGTQAPAGTTIDLNELKRELYQETPAVTQPQNINITVNIPETKENTTYITTTPEYKPEQPKVVQAPEPVKVVKAKNTATPAAKPAAAPAAKKAKAEPAPEVKKITQFWVQVAAYSNKKGAEGARSRLDENKIPADIFTYKDSKDNMFYRVRVGPYTTKSEAEYWRTKIVKIDDFANAESYITSTTK